MTEKADITLTVNGSNFVNGTTVVKFGSTSLATTCASATRTASSTGRRGRIPSSIIAHIASPSEI